MRGRWLAFLAGMVIGSALTVVVELATVHVVAEEIGEWS